MDAKTGENQHKGRARIFFTGLSYPLPGHPS